MVDGALLAINGCCTLLPAVQRSIGDLAPGEAITQGGVVVAARCTAAELLDHVNGAGALGSRSTELDGRALASTPWATLDRGYSVVQKSDGAIVTDPASLAPGEKIQLRMAKGVALATALGSQEDSKSE